MATIITKDSLRSSVESATGGLCTVLYDDAGHPSFMRRIPKMRIEDLYPDLGLTGTHPAFIVNGVEKSELFIGMYPASLVDSYAVSLPGMDPANSLNFDSAVTYCKNKGTGWHLMTNAEWALLGALGIKTGFQRAATPTGASTTKPSTRPVRLPPEPVSWVSVTTICTDAR